MSHVFADLVIGACFRLPGLGVNFVKESETIARGGILGQKHLIPPTARVTVYYPLTITTPNWIKR